MNQTDEFLERIRQTEVQNLDKMTKLYTGITIQTTKDTAGASRVKKDISNIVFKPDKYFKLAVLTFGFILIGYLVKETVFKSNIALSGLILGYILSTIIIYTAIKQFYFNKALNYVITIDSTGIRIDDTTFPWKNIYETAILTKGGGKYKTKYLIIAMHDLTTYEMFQLTQFINLNYRGFSSTLSKYIEYFKPIKF